MLEQSLAEAVVDFAEIHVLDVRPLPEWQRRLIGQLYSEAALSVPLSLKWRH